MRPARVIEMPSASTRQTAPVSSRDFSWSVLGWIGVLLVVVGAQDLILTLVPARFGNPEWEFGTVTAVLNGMPVLAMGLGLMLASAAAQGRHTMMKVMAAVLFALAAVILVGFTLYALTIPLALKTVPDPVLAMGLKKAVAKTALQAVVYPLAFTALGIAAVRRVTRRT